MAYELTGKIKLIKEPKTYDSGFTKREMVVIFGLMEKPDLMQRTFTAVETRAFLVF